jgi:hypothetical protein
MGSVPSLIINNIPFKTSSDGVVSEMAIVSSIVLNSHNKR